MPSRRDGLPANQPALLPLHGNTDKKPRPLDRDVTTIGRARGSDLCLDANEISTVHCLVFRTPEGYRIRDCHSRTGTRVNGEKVRSGALHDGDVLNVGPFSFEVKIPREVFDPDIRHLDPMRVKHWQESRRRFAEYALVLRQRMRQSGAEGSDHRPDLEAQTAQLRDKIRAYDQRAGQLEAAERELETEKAALTAERDAVEGRVQKVEKELAQRLAAVDQEIHRRWQEFQQRCQAEEERQQRELEERLVRQRQEVPAAPVPHPADNERARRLDERERQLEHQLDEVQRDRQEFFRMKDESDREEAARAELSAALKAQKAELARMIAELRQLQESVRQQQSADVQTLSDENQQLRQVVAEYEQRLAHDAAPAHAAAQQRLLDDLRAENELIRELLEEKEQAAASRPAGAAETDAALPMLQAQLDDVRVENDLLKQVIRQKDDQVEEMRRRAAPEPARHDDGELERYEAELNQFRQQLEADRSKMQHEIEQLRVKNEELEETTREVEMQFSRERAEMARERIRLERLRDELRADTEKMQREMSMRDSLASVQKLRDELKKNGSAEKPPDKTVTDRLRAFRSNGSDHGN